MGNVVHQVLHEQMDRQHRQERNECARHQHRKHISEVGAGGHIEVFHDVAEGFAPLQHTLLKNHQALLEQDNIGRLLRDISAAVDGNANIGIAQRRSVIDAVAEEADGVPVGLECL